MAELIEQQEPPVGEHKYPPRARGGFWFGIIVLLLVLLMAGAGFFLFTQLRAKQENLGGEVKSEMSKQLGGYQSQLLTLQNQIAALQTEMANKDAHFSKTVSDFSKMHEEKLDNTRKELNNSILLLQRQLGKTRGDWLIADAEYLLSVANERLYLIGDVNTTRQALEAADQRLRESGDASAFKVRDQVIKDIAALASVKPIDVVGLYSSLQVLESRIDHLALLLPYSGKMPEASSKAESPAPQEAQDVAGLIDTAKSKLSEIVTIKHTDHLVKEILTPEQAAFIRDQLRVKLEVVKIALVQQNEALYQTGLTDAKQWLEQQFSQDGEFKAFASELNRFAAIKLRSQFPDISLSLKTLRDITKLRIETDKTLEPIEPTNSNPTSGMVDKVTDAVKLGPETPAMPSTDEPASATEPPTSVAPPEVEAKPTSPAPELMPEPAPAVSPVPEAPVQEPTPVGQVEPPIVQPAPENQPVDETVEPTHPPAGKTSQVDRIIDEIKQFLPGKH